jgi:lysozyme
MTPAEFVNTYGNAVINATLDNTLFPSVKLAQMALESSWGSKGIGNNMFGIKASGQLSPYWNGSAINQATHEVFNGATVSVSDYFRNYSSVEDSIKDHSYFLQTNPRYTEAGVFSAATPEAQAKALQAAKYATDPEYSAKLIQIINKYNFKALDEKKKLRRG